MALSRPERRASRQAAGAVPSTIPTAALLRRRHGPRRPVTAPSADRGPHRLRWCWSPPSRLPYHEQCLPPPLSWRHRRLAPTPSARPDLERRVTLAPAMPRASANVRKSSKSAARSGTYTASSPAAANAALCMAGERVHRVAPDHAVEPRLRPQFAGIGTRSSMRRPAPAGRDAVAAVGPARSEARRQQPRRHAGVAHPDDDRIAVACAISRSGSVSASRAARHRDLDDRGAGRAHRATLCQSGRRARRRSRATKPRTRRCPRSNRSSNPPDPPPHEERAIRRPRTRPRSCNASDQDAPSLLLAAVEAAALPDRAAGHDDRDGAGREAPAPRRGRATPSRRSSTMSASVARIAGGQQSAIVPPVTVSQSNANRCSSKTKTPLQPGAEEASCLLSSCCVS